jgi:YHS domain-containing protein
VGWILRVILIIIVVRVLWRFVYGIAQGLSGPSAPEKPVVGLQRDPVCGTFVVPSRALTARSGDEVRFFCSERCRQAWSRK